MFEKSIDKNIEYVKPLTYYNNFSAISTSAKCNVSTSDNNASSNNMTNLTSSNYNTTSTPVSSGIVHSYQGYRRNALVTSKSSSHLQFANSVPSKLTDTFSRLINDRKSTTSHYDSPELKPLDSSVNMKEFHAAIKDLDAFLAKELNEIEIQKRIGLTNKEKLLKVNKERDTRYGEQVLDTLQKLKTEINEIKLNQQGIKEKMRKQEEYQYTKLRSLDEHSVKMTSDSSLYNPSTENVLKKKASYVEKKSSKECPKFELKKFNEEMQSQQSAKRINSFESPILASSGYSKHERIRKLEAEIYKAETLMMKINKVLENLRHVEDRNLIDIVNIERHFLVASTRFQSALSELRKLNEGAPLPHQPPYNRKGKLLVRDIMLEVKASYFQRAQPQKNEFLMILMKYEDKVFATKPVRIIDDVRILKFSEKISIPEMYIDFNIRLEIYGTTFWRKDTSVRETMLKKYGFTTFCLADTGNKSKRFQMIEVLQSDNIPIKNKVVMKITQKITTDVKYKGKLFVKLRDVWHEAFACLNGHLLEISFNKIYNSGISQSQETMLLDLYNIDSDAAIPVDVKRISDKSYAFLLKFNHYVDVANF